MKYIPKSIRRPAGSPGAGLKTRDSIVLYKTDDILYMPSPDEKGVLIEEDIVMRKGRYGIEVYMTPGTVEQTSPAEGETDAIGFKPSVKFRHPGNELEVREFKVDSINSKYIGVIRHCSGKPADLIGSMCNPCKITPSYTGNNESNANEFTLEQISAGDDFYMYKGNIPLEEVEELRATGGDGNGVTVQAVPGARVLYSETDTIVVIDGGSEGDIFTIMGGGPADTTGKIAAGDLTGTGNILLHGGNDFNCTEGSQITLRAYSLSADDLVWIEQSRYENV